MHRKFIWAIFLCLFLVPSVRAQDFLGDSPAVDKLEIDDGSDSYPATVAADGSLRGVVVCIDEVELAVSESGVLTQALSEGDIVSEGDVVARTDDTDAKARRMMAFYGYKAAEKEISSTIRMQYAEKNMEVAKAAYDDAVAANRRQKKAISEFEVRRRKFEWESGMLNIENTQHEMDVAKVTLQEKKAEYEAATLMLRHHEVRAPISGIVEKKYLGKGSFVRPGDPICRILRLDRMRVQFEVPIGMVAPAELKGKTVTVRVEVGSMNGEPVNETFEGKIDFVSPSMELNDVIRAWAEFDNRGDFVVRKNMVAWVTIH